MGGEPAARARDTLPRGGVPEPIITLGVEDGDNQITTPTAHDIGIKHVGTRGHKDPEHAGSKISIIHHAIQTGRKPCLCLMRLPIVNGAEGNVCFIYKNGRFFIRPHNANKLLTNRVCLSKQ